MVELKLGKITIGNPTKDVSVEVFSNHWNVVIDNMKDCISPEVFSIANEHLYVLLMNVIFEDAADHIESQINEEEN